MFYNGNSYNKMEFQTIEKSMRDETMWETLDRYRGANQSSSKTNMALTGFSNSHGGNSIDNSLTPYSWLDYLGSFGLKMESVLKVNEKRALNFADLEKLVRANEHKLEYMKERDAYMDQRKATVGVAMDANDNVITIPDASLDMKEFNASFISTNAIVRNGLHRGNHVFYIRDRENNRHRVIEIPELTILYEDALSDAWPDGGFPSKDFLNRWFRKMVTGIPRVDRSGLTILPHTKVAFRNGHFDIETGVFKEIPPSDSHKYFNIFSLDLNYEIPAQGLETRIFDKMLEGYFGDDESKKHYLYQIIGAILTPLTTMKIIFLFQGKTGAGKTTLSNIISYLLPQEEVCSVHTMDEITNGFLKNPQNPIRLLYVKEHGNKKVADKQTASLKAFSDGSDGPSATTFKVLINTNHIFRTGEGTFIEPAMRARLAVLPFEKSFSKDDVDDEIAAFQDYGLQNEKLGIILKALKAFAEVIKTGSFCCTFPVNECVETVDASYGGTLSEEEMNRLEEVQIDSLTDKLQLALDKLFVLDEEGDPMMAAKDIIQAIADADIGLSLRAADLGKKLREYYPELKSARVSRNGTTETCYNLLPRNNSTENGFPNENELPSEHEV